MSAIPYLSELSSADTGEGVAADNVLETLELLAAGDIPAPLRDNEESDFDFWRPLEWPLLSSSNHGILRSV